MGLRRERKCVNKHFYWLKHRTETRKKKSVHTSVLLRLKSPINPEQIIDESIFSTFFPLESEIFFLPNIYIHYIYFESYRFF